MDAFFFELIRVLMDFDFGDEWGSFAPPPVKD